MRRTRIKWKMACSHLASSTEEKSFQSAQNGFSVGKRGVCHGQSKHNVAPETADDENFLDQYTVYDSPVSFDEKLEVRRL